jgi:uncharacterized protein (DUF1800 family)
MTHARTNRLLAAILVPLTLLAASSANAQTTDRFLTASEVANHVLNRISFGARPEEMEEVHRIGWKNWVDEQLRPENRNDYLTDKRISEHCPSLAFSLDEWQQYAGKDKQIAQLHQQLVDSVILRAVYGRRQFNEVIADFWRNHFNVYLEKVPLLATHFEQHVLRKHAFGKFEDLLLATAKHPAMLVYLDNYVSRGGNVNENYARELMELHTLGVDNGYSQKDVVDLARALTGWTCGSKRGSDGRKEYGFVFRADVHDDGPASVVGLTLGGQGVADGERAVRHLANHQATAHFISLKLCRHLVSDVPPASFVDRVAQVFHASGGDLREVYRAIVASPEFMNARNFRVKFKTPFEFVVSTLRNTGAEIQSTEQLRRELEQMGQPIYGCVEPTGYDDRAEAWLDPGVMVYRWNFAIALVQGKIEGVKVGEDFARQVLKPQQRARTKQVMAHVLPGVTDAAAQRLLLQTTDIRAMVALALGSQSYQQQ